MYRLKVITEDEKVKYINTNQYSAHRIDGKVHISYLDSFTWETIGPLISYLEVRTQETFHTILVSGEVHTELRHPMDCSFCGKRMDGVVTLLGPYTAHPDCADVEREYVKFWKEIVEDENGVLQIPLIKRELYDYSKALDTVSKTYDQLTGGRISKLNTDPSYVVEYSKENFKHEFTEDNLVAMAFGFAMECHSGQMRKWTGEHYITHPVSVAQRLKAAGIFDSKVIAAALLHDTVEDTEATYADVLNEFGLEVAKLVSEVTDCSKKSDGCRAVRKRKDLEHLAKASPEGMSIKLADIIDNCDSVVDKDPKFAKIYMQEKRNLIAVLQQGDPGLLRQATELVDGYFNSLESEVPHDNT